MLDIQNVKKRKDYLVVMNKGEKVVSSSFIIFFYYGLLDVHKLISTHKLESSNILSVGYTVSSKVGNAVVRNKIKRRFKNMVQQTFKEINDSKTICNKSSLPLSFCFVARYRARDCDFNKMKRDFAKILSKYV